MTEPPDMGELINKRDYGIGQTKGIGGVLAELWRKTLRDLNMPYGRFEFLCNQFVQRARLGLTDARVANYFNRGNLRRELAKPTMTMKVFIKALKVIDCTSMTISIELKHRGGDTSIHTHSVDLSAMVDEDEGGQE